MASTESGRISHGDHGVQGAPPGTSPRGTNGQSTSPGSGAATHPRKTRKHREFRWPRQTWAITLITVFAWLAATALIAYMIARALTNPGDLRMPDLHVYRNGGAAVLHGNADSALYAGKTNGSLLFTYPPLSAVLAVPLAWVPWQAAQVLWMPMVYLPLAVVIWYAFRPLLRRAQAAGRYGLAAFAGLLACLTLIQPMRQEVHYGQIDIFLVALCVVDCLARRAWWPRGALIGLATAIKLVPGVFVVYLLITGRRKAAAVAAGSFAVWTGLAWLIAPGASRFYWLHAVFDTRRLGQNAQAANQSLRGILLRVFFPHPPPGALLIAVALVVAVAGFAAARIAWQRGFELGGLAITGLLAALLSPVSWVHHYCWIILAIGAIAGDCRSERRVIAAIVTGGLFTSVLPIFGGYLYFTGTVPSLPGLILEDAFGLAALGLIWALYRIRVTEADQAVVPAQPGPAPAPVQV